MRCLGILVCGLLACSKVSEALELSAVDQRQFAFRRDPDTLCIRPGNDGPIVLGKPDSVTTQPGRLEVWQDEYCDARWLALDSEAYTFRPDDGGEYWSRLDGYAVGMSNEGLVALWVINDEFLESWRINPAIADTLTSHILSYPGNDVIAPTLVFRLSQWSIPADLLRTKLEAEMHAPLLGGWVTASNCAGMPRRAWGFIIAEEETAPENFRGQALPAWLRAQFGEIPVIISPAVPDFETSMVWLGTGASGLQFRELPASGTSENTAAARQIRAISTFPDRFKGHVRLKPEGRQKEIRIELTTADPQNPNDLSAAWLLQNGVQNLKIDLPDKIVGRSITGVWYNPATDENIMEPVTTATRQLNLAPPGRDSWAYSVTVSHSVPDTATTVSAIRDWED